MATYLELQEIQRNESFRSRVAVACVISAETIRLENPATPNHDARLAWARTCYQNPGVAASSMVWPVLAQNSGLSQAAILGSTDAQLQTAVNAAINVFSG